MSSFRDAGRMRLVDPPPPAVRPGRTDERDGGSFPEGTNEDDGTPGDARESDVLDLSNLAYCDFAPEADADDTVSPGRERCCRR